MLPEPDDGAMPVLRRARTTARGAAGPVVPRDHGPGTTGVAGVMAIVVKPAHAALVVRIAGSLAASRGCRLAVLAVAPPAPASVWCSPLALPLTPEGLTRAAWIEAHLACLDAVRGLPDAVGVDCGVVIAAAHSVIVRPPPWCPDGPLVIGRTSLRDWRTRQALARWERWGGELYVVGDAPSGQHDESDEQRND